LAKFAVDEGGGTAAGEEFDEEDGGGEACALKDERGATEDFDGFIEPSVTVYLSREVLTLH
jgi:hypothetical protein